MAAFKLKEGERLYTNAEVCEILGISTRTLSRYVAKGKLKPRYTPGGRRRYTLADLSKCITEHNPTRRTK